MKVMFDDGRIRVGDYERGQIYDVPEDEAERLVTCKGFVFFDDSVSLIKREVNEDAAS